MNKNDIRKFKDNMDYLQDFCQENLYHNIYELVVAFIADKEPDYEWWINYTIKEIRKDYAKKEFGNNLSEKQINILIDNIDNGFYLFGGVYPRIITKEEEIKILENFKNTNSYFNNQFSDEQIQLMIENIKNDFPLLVGIEIKK